MERSKKSSRILTVGVILFCVSFVFAVQITRDRFPPVYTLQDDRAASTINENFRRALNIIVEDRQFNASLNDTSSFTVVTLNVAQPDTEYGIFLTMKSSATVLNKTVETFKIEHAPQGAGAVLDWILVRRSEERRVGK